MARKRSRTRGGPHPQDARQNRHQSGARMPTLSEEELIHQVQSAKEVLLLILDGVQDPRNLGACLRSADGAGVMAVVAPKDRAARMNETVKRVSCGGAENVPFVPVANLARCLKKLQEAGLWLVGTDDEAKEELYDVDLKGKIGMVLGAEEDGLRRLTAENCDHLVTIPMKGKVECLNVSVAAGICLYEAVRQRRA